MYYFLLKPPMSAQCCQFIPGCMAIFWSSFFSSASLKRIHSLFPSRHQMPLIKGWAFMTSSLLYTWILCILICAHSHNHCGLKYATTLTYPDNSLTAAMPQTPLAFIFFWCHLLQWSLNVGKKGMMLMPHSGLNITIMYIMSSLKPLIIANALLALMPAAWTPERWCAGKETALWEDWKS